MYIEPNKGVLFLFWGLVALGIVAVCIAIAIWFGTKLAVWVFTGCVIVVAIFLMMVN